MASIFYGGGKDDADAENKRVFKWIALALFCLVVIIVAGMLTIPYYNVWEQRMAGKAELAKAEYNRNIAVVEAEAKKVSAEKLAEAEVARARGVAQANQIIGESLNNNEAYLRYLWIQGLQTNQMQVVYVPTEANLPILEASRKLNG